jgi:FkbM family methyltransferase
MPFYGEHSTDQVIRSFFPDLSHKGTFIDVGAGKPDFLSLSRHFKESGWTVVCIEANPAFAKLHRDAGNRIVECAASNYNADSVDFTVCKTHLHGLGGIVTMEAASALKSTVRYQKAGAVTSGEIIKVKVRTLDAILAEMPDIKSTDVVTIDVEGGELDVLGGFTQRRLYPHLFIIECLFEDRIGQDMALMNSLGYKFVTHQVYNYFYLRTS